MIVAPLTPRLRLWDTPLPTERSEVRNILQIQTALLIAAVTIARLRRQAFEMTLGLLVLAASLVALFGMRRIPERIEVHTVLWVCVFGVLSWSVILAVLFSFLVHSRYEVIGRGAIVATAVLAIVVCARGIVDRRAEDARHSRLVYGLTSLVRARIDEVGDRHPHIRVPPAFWGLATGVVHQLYRGDIRPSVDADRVGMFGRPFAPTGRERVTIQFAEQDEHDKDLSKRSHYRLLGSVDGFYVYSVEPLRSH